MLTSWSPTALVGTLTIAAASAMTATAPVFSRSLLDAGVTPATIAWSRYAMAALVLGRLVRLTGPTASSMRWGLGSGIVLGLGWIAYVRSVEAGDLAEVGVAYMTYPLFALLVSAGLFGRRITPRAGGAALLVVVAAAVAFAPSMSAGWGDTSAMFFLAPIAMGASVSVLVERLGPLDPFERLAAVSCGAVLALTPVVFTTSDGAGWPVDPAGWVLLIGIGLVCALVPMTLYGAVAPSLGAARASVAGAVELPTMFLIGALAYGEVIRVEHVVAAAIVVVAVASTPSARTVHVLPEIDEPSPCVSPRVSDTRGDADADGIVAGTVSRWSSSPARGDPR